MDVLIASLLISILGLLAYLFKSNRVLGTKLSKVDTHLKKSLTLSQVEKAIAKSEKSNFQLFESYLQLLQLLNLKEAIPPTRSYAASPDLLLELLRIVRAAKPTLVVELGSGVSTLIISKSLDPQSSLISIDHSEEFAGLTRKLLSDHGAENTEVLVAPIDPETNWYGLNGLQELNGVDLLVIDGPPQSIGIDARHPAIYFLPKLSSQATVVIDDANRDSERRLAEIFAESMPSHSLTFLKHEKGTAVIHPKI